MSVRSGLVVVLLFVLAGAGLGWLLVQRSEHRADLLEPDPSLQPLKSFLGHSWDVIAVRFSPNGRQIASGGGQDVKIWEIDSGQMIMEKKVNKPHEIHCLAFSHDGRWLVAATFQGLVYIWNTVNWQEERVLDVGSKSGVSSIAMSPDGKEIAIGCGPGDGDLRLWDWGAKRLVPYIPRNGSGHFG